MSLAALKPSHPIKICVFAGYGTLFDMRGLVKACGQKAGTKARDLLHLWQQKQAEMAQAAADQEDGPTDFWHLTGAALDAAMDSLKIKNNVLRSHLMQTYVALNVFPKVKSVLHKLKEKGLKTAVLSNASSTMLTGLLNRAGLSPLFDHIFAARDVGETYKPDLIVYKRLAESLQVEPQEICYVASCEKDLAAAQQAGFTTWAVFPEAEDVGEAAERTGANLMPIEQLPETLAA